MFSINVILKVDSTALTEQKTTGHKQESPQQTVLVGKPTVYTNCAPNGTSIPPCGTRGKHTMNLP